MVQRRLKSKLARAVSSTGLRASNVLAYFGKDDEKKFYNIWHEIRETIIDHVHEKFWAHSGLALPGIDQWPVL